MNDTEKYLSWSMLKWSIDVRVVWICLFAGPFLLSFYLSYNKILEGSNLIILILCWYIFSIPLTILYLRYRSKKEIQKRIEQRDLEEKVFLKNLRK